MSLRWRILLFPAGSIVLILALLSFFGISATKESTDQVLAERLLLAEQVAHNIDFNLQQSLNYLDESGVQADPGGLAAGFQQYSSLKVLYVSEVNLHGQVLQLNPAPPSRANGSLTKSPTGSESFRQSNGHQHVLRSNDQHSRDLLDSSLSGSDGLALCAAMNLRRSMSHLINVSVVGKTGYVELVDSNGIVLSSSNSANLLKESDHGGVFAGLIKKMGKKRFRPATTAT